MSEPNSASSRQPDSVIIAGAGPSGLVCALLLVRAGIPVTVLEQGAGLAEDMRASTFHPATLDLLQGTGVVQTLLGQGTRVPRWQFLRHGTDDRIVWDMAVLADVTAHPYRLQAEQFRLTSAIVDRLRDEPAFRLRRGARVTHVAQDAERVTVHFEENGANQVETCRWLIGADGGRSTVRNALGLEFAGSVFPRTSITLVLDEDFQAQLESLLGVNYVWTENGHYSLMRVRDLWRFSFSPLDEGDPVEARDTAAAEARLQAVFPREAPYRIKQVNHYTIQQRCLASFRAGRVLFCGDAAHLNSPAGGMGMNSGVHDAVCLAEHLLPVLRGGDTAMLDRYDRRRRTVATEEVQRLSARNYRRHRETDPVRREAIWAELKATAADPQAHREFLLDASMIRSRQREEEIA